jgi:hypothetical protein
MTGGETTYFQRIEPSELDWSSHPQPQPCVCTPECILQKYFYQVGCRDGARSKLNELCVYIPSVFSNNDIVGTPHGSGSNGNKVRQCVSGMFSKCLCRYGCDEVICQIPDATSLSTKLMLTIVARRANVISSVVDFMPDEIPHFSR